MMFNTYTVRELLLMALSDEKLTILCFDHFRCVHQQFTDTMNRSRKVQLLVEYCDGHDQMERLLALIKTENSYQYGRFESRLSSRPSSSTLDMLPPNPFVNISEARNTRCFVGRKTELRRLHMLLQAGSVILVGPMKIGLSSLLWQFIPSGRQTCVGPIDCLELEDRDDLYEQMAEGLRVQGHSWRVIRQALKSREILLLVDDLDAAPARGITIDDLAYLRAIASNNARFRMIAVSHQPLKEVFPHRGPDSPGYILRTGTNCAFALKQKSATYGRVEYSFLQPCEIGPLTSDESRLLLSHPWAPSAPQFDEATFIQLLMLTSGHPFKLCRAAFHRYEAQADPSYDWVAAYRQDLEHLLA
jgi:hypothetical protein